MAMRFAEKLDKLTEGRNRAELSRQADLPPNAISDYINKKHWPRLDIAHVMAKMLGVDLGWLADDAAGWPPPPPAEISDAGLMMMVLARTERAANDLAAAYVAITKFDWGSIAADPPPDGAATQVERLWSEMTRCEERFAMFRIDWFGNTDVGNRRLTELAGAAYPLIKPALNRFHINTIRRFPIPTEVLTGAPMPDHAKERQ